MPLNPPLKLHFVSHTHWDREWYFPFNQFRVFLVGTVDLLLDLLRRNSDYKYFMLDGQTIVLEDYLEVKPEKVEALKRFIREGRILVGPWYVQPDEFLLSGEALVRNLLLGHKLASKFGKVMRVGYLPDSFGQCAQMPQILNGFGIDSAVFARGIANEPVKTEFRWKALDGSEVLAVHLRQTYCNAGYLPKKIGKALECLNITIKELNPHCSTRNLLLMDGCDHLPPRAELPKLIESINKNWEGFEAFHSTLEEYINAIKADQPSLVTLKGEFRGARFSPILPNVLSSRVQIKKENQATDYELRLAEVLATLAWLKGKEYPENFLTLGWKYFLQNTTHDDICGCSRDEVYGDIETRYRQSKQIARAVAEESLNYLLAKRKAKVETLLVFNPLSWKREALIKTESENFPLKEENKEVQAQKLRDKILFKAKLPACGWKIYRIGMSANPPKDPLKSYSRAKAAIENEELKLEALPSGKFKLIDKQTSQTIEVGFEDVGDKGDEYNFCALPGDKPLAKLEKVRISKVEGPVCRQIKIQGKLKVPSSLTQDRKRRNKKEVSLPISAKGVLYPGLKRADFELELENRAKDHRLRVVFKSGLKVNYSRADTPYGIVRRGVELPEGKDWSERPTSFQPKQFFAEVGEGKDCFTVLTPNLYEYEATKEGVALTLLRSVGWLLRNDLPGRASEWGIDLETPGAQCLGKHKFGYALIPEKIPYSKALEYCIPCKVFKFKEFDQKSPKERGFLEVEPKELILTVVKKAEKRDALVLRLYNPTERTIKGRVKLNEEIGSRVKSVWLTNMLEEQVKRINLANFEVKPFKIITLSLELKPEPKSAWRKIKPIPPVRKF
jgi:mannosylglycerate hydrolase